MTQAFAIHEIGNTYENGTAGVDELLGEFRESFLSIMSPLPCVRANWMPR